MARIVIEEPCQTCEGTGSVSGWPDTPWERCPVCKDENGVRRRVLDPGSYVLAAQICSECGGSFGQCFQAKVKCCPDCNHFPDGRDLVQWCDALAGGEQ